MLVTGPANNPKFTFSSIPSLPEDEVMARLVFGRSMSNLSPIQIAQLAEAAAQFAGVGGSTSLLDTLRGKIGVDDLDIKTDDQGGTAVSAGKYLNDRTYVTIEKGDKAGSGKAAIDLDIGRGVKLRGEATRRRRGQGRHLLRARILTGPASAGIRPGRPLALSRPAAFATQVSDRRSGLRTNLARSTTFAQQIVVIARTAPLDSAANSHTGFRWAVPL